MVLSWAACLVNIESDAKAIREALDVTFSADAYALIDLLAKYTNEQAQELLNYYNNTFKADLLQKLKKKTGGDVSSLFVASLTPLACYEAKQINKAFAGFGCDEDRLIELLCTRTDEQLTVIATEYQNM